MNTHTLILILLLAAGTAVLAAQSPPAATPGKADAAVQSPPPNPDDDFQTTMEAYRKEASVDKQYELWLGFLTRHPDSQYSLDVIEQTATRYFLEAKKDPEAAYRFAGEWMARIQDPRSKGQIPFTWLALYAAAGNKEKVREKAAEIEQGGGVKLAQHLALIEAGLKVEDWPLVQKTAEALLGKATADTVKAERKGQEIPEDRLKRTVSYYQGEALTMLAWSLANQGQTEQAFDRFKEAAVTVGVSYVGLPTNDLHLYWARALLKAGQAQAALDLIAPDALLADNSAALKILEQAYGASGHDPATLPAYLEVTRQKVARPMLDFVASDYSGNRKSYAELKGKVTLLTFWFPT